MRLWTSWSDVSHGFASEQAYHAPWERWRTMSINQAKHGLLKSEGLPHLSLLTPRRRAREAPVQIYFGYKAGNIHNRRLTSHCRSLHHSSSAVLEQACMRSLDCTFDSKYTNRAKPSSEVVRLSRDELFTLFFVRLLFLQQNLSFSKSSPWIINWCAAIPGHRQLSLHTCTPEKEERLIRGKGLKESGKGRGRNSDG